MNYLRIKTPEGIVFSLLLAGPLTRFLAWLVDCFVVLAATLVVSRVIRFVGLVSTDLAEALSILVYFAMSIGYGIVTEWAWRGQTLGKRVLRLRVMDSEGMRLHFSQIVIRNLLRFVDMLPFFYLVGGITTLLNRKAQRLGDLAANTVVVRIPQLGEPDIDQFLSNKFNSLRDHPHLEARLRQRVSAQEATLALQALLRREQLDPAARVELFGELAAHFRSLVQFPPEIIEGITDEQYIRDVVEIVFRPRGSGRESAREEPRPAAAVH